MVITSNKIDAGGLAEPMRSKIDAKNISYSFVPILSSVSEMALILYPYAH